MVEEGADKIIGDIEVDLVVAEQPVRELFTVVIWPRAAELKRIRGVALLPVGLVLED